MEWLHMTAKEYRETIRTRGKAQPAAVAGKTQAKSLSYPATGNKSSNKYNAQKTVINGVQFDSRRESLIYQNLLNLQNKGIITHLERQKRFEIIPKTKTERAAYYVADYFFQEVATGQWVVADCKSPITKKLPAYVLKRKLMRYRYPEYEFREM